MATLETLREEIKDIKGDVQKILLILENEGTVRENVLKDLEEARRTPADKYLKHDNVKKLIR